jgi:hypothetical protein
MKTSEVRRMVFAVMFTTALLASAHAGDTSSPVFVFLRPETSSFWHTATNCTMSLPVDFPRGATRATLSVVGVEYSAVYENVPDGAFMLTLPPAVSPETENVYDLTLSFDDGTVRRAKLGLVQGRLADAQGATRCVAPAEGRLWRRVKRRAVLPIPYGTTSFTVNGVDVDTGLGAEQGWYALGPLAGCESADVAVEVGGDAWGASLFGAGGLLFWVQ